MPENHKIEPKINFFAERVYVLGYQVRSETFLEAHCKVWERYFHEQTIPFLSSIPDTNAFKPSP